MWNLSSVREPVIFVTGARHLEVSKTPQLHSVGEAAFSLEEDRRKVSKVLAVEFQKSLVKCLERGELAKYRFLLGWQKLGSGVSCFITVCLTGSLKSLYIPNPERP